MIKDLKECRPIVESILSKYPASRDSDKLLMMLVWKQQGLALPYGEESFWFDICFNPESISRTRRKFQEMGMYKGTKRVEDERELEEEAVKEAMKDEEPYQYQGDDLWDTRRINGKQ